MACPQGSSYSVASTQYTAFSDGRDCTCACNPNPNNPTCSPTVDYIDTTTGTGCLAPSGDDFMQCGTVYAGSTHGFRIKTLNLTVSGTTSFTPTGSVSAASPLTVCCTN
jgi:hypothetical protein